jgi:DNA-binding transcriptional ArsR family regulator
VLEAAAKAIAEPRRRQILTLVRDGELSSGDIAAALSSPEEAIER